MKYSSRLITFILVLFSVLSMSAYTVSGRVVEQSSGETEPFATVRIYDKGEKTRPILIEAGDINGKFCCKLPETGDYTLNISYAGMKIKNIDFTISSSTPDVDLGKIQMESSVDELDELTVVATKPIIETTGDKIVYNAEVDETSKDKTVLEMLHNVPMVTVDGNDQIKVNGQSDFKIYINGQPNPMLNGSNKSDILKAMPASSVKRVEVLTEPGAKYDAEGVGGILNLVTQTTSSLGGKTATIGLSVRNDQLMGNIYAMAGMGKVVTSLSYGYGYISPFYKQIQNFHEERETYNSTDFRHTVNDLSVSYNGQFHYGDFQFSFEPDTLNLFTVSANGFFTGVQGNMEGVTNHFNPDMMLTMGYDQNIKLSMNYASLTISAAYQHTFCKPGHNLIATYQYGYGNNKTQSTNIYSNLNGVGLLPENIKNLVKTPTNEHTLQIDYTLPFGVGHVFETGAKAILRRNKSIGNLFNYIDDKFELSTSASSSLKQFQDVAAVYASATGVWRGWMLKAGLRYEYTHMGVNYIAGNYDDFVVNLNDLVPNAMLSYKLSEVSNLRLSYQMRIRRPAASQLNPYRNVNYNGPSQVQYGNPNLTSERNNNVKLTYSSFVNKFMFNLSAEYSQSNNLISQYSFIKDGILNQTYANIGNGKNFDISGYISCSAIKNIQMGLNARAEYAEYNYSEMNLRNHGWNFNFNFNFNYSMPWALKLSGYAGLGTEEKNLQSKYSGYHYYGLSISRSFLKDDPLHVAISVNNFIGGHQVFNMQEWGDGFFSKSRSEQKNWAVGLNISYRFGKLDSTVKKVSKMVENDDVKSVKANESGIGGR